MLRSDFIFQTYVTYAVHYPVSFIKALNLEVSLATLTHGLNMTVAQVPRLLLDFLA